MTEDIEAWFGQALPQSYRAFLNAQADDPAFAEVTAESFGDWLACGCPLPGEEVA